jgi:hypothetical protein
VEALVTIRFAGIERVTAPVAALAVIWFAVPVIEETPAEAPTHAPLLEVQILNPFIVVVPIEFVVPETVKLPPKYTLPEEWTERREPGVVVPMPTEPFGAINKLLAVAFRSTLKAALFPTVSPPVIVDVPVVLVTLRRLSQAVSETVR